MNALRMKRVPRNQGLDCRYYPEKNEYGQKRYVAKMKKELLELREEGKRSTLAVPKPFVRKYNDIHTDTTLRTRLYR